MTNTLMSSSSSSAMHQSQHGPLGPLSAPSRHASTSTSATTSTSTIPSNLRLKLAGDALVGTTFTFFVSPFLFVVDKAIAQRASGTNTMVRSAIQSLHGLVTNPVAFVKSPAFLYVWAVYASTYTVANTLKTLVEHEEQARKQQQQQTNDSDSDSDSTSHVVSYGRLAIFLGTSITNSGGSAIKDRFIAQKFAARDSLARAAKVPVTSYALWMSRDLVSIGSSFVLPDLIARKFADSSNPEEVTQLRDISQICVPIATQLVAGPLHLLGLDLFNRPMHDLSLQRRIVEHSKFLVHGYGAAVGARIARIIPGYGLGGVLNTHLRDSWRNHLVQRESNEGKVQVEKADKQDRYLEERETSKTSTLSHWDGGSRPLLPM